MSLLARVLRRHPTTDMYEYQVVDGPPVVVSSSGAKTITPDTVTVKVVNGKFRRMTIGGPCVEVPEIRITRRYTRPADVPDWATRYLAQIEQR